MIKINNEYVIILVPDKLFYLHLHLIPISFKLYPGILSNLRDVERSLGHVSKLHGRPSYVSQAALHICQSLIETGRFTYYRREPRLIPAQFVV